MRGSVEYGIYSRTWIFRSHIGFRLFSDLEEITLWYKIVKVIQCIEINRTQCRHITHQMVDFGAVLKDENTTIQILLTDRNLEGLVIDLIPVVLVRELNPRIPAARITDRLPEELILGPIKLFRKLKLNTVRCPKPVLNIPLGAGQLIRGTNRHPFLGTHDET